MTGRLQGRRMVWLTVLGVVAVAAMEAVTRLDDWARFGAPLRSNTVGITDLLVIDSLGAHARPNAQFRQFRINALGLRGPEINLTNRTTTPFIIVSGASESFGLYESNGREWPRQLEDSLRTGCASRSVVGNASFSGMSLPTVEQDIRRRISALHPTAVVYYPTPMQYLEDELPIATQPNAHRATAGGDRPRLRFLPRIREAVKRIIPEPVLDLLRQRETRALRRGLTETVRDEAPLDRLDRFEEGLRSLIASVRHIKATPVLVVHQNRFAGRTEDQEVWLRAWERFYPSYTGRAIVEFDRLAGERTRRVAADSGVLVVDPAPALAATRGVPFADFSHFNDEGAAIVAGAVARAMETALCAAR